LRKRACVPLLTVDALCIDQKLPDSRFRCQSRFAERIVIGGHIAPSNGPEAASRQGLINLTLRNAIEEKSAHGKVIDIGDGKAEFPDYRTIKFPRDLGDNAGAVTGLSIGADRPAVGEVLDRLNAPCDDLPVALARDAADKTDTAA
jgi:hypothetical protein